MNTKREAYKNMRSARLASTNTGKRRMYVGRVSVTYGGRLSPSQPPLINGRA